jgi:hypothetical protein
VASRHFRNNEEEYPEIKVNELAVNKKTRTLDTCVEE